MESDLDLLTALVMNPSLTLDEARRDAAATTALSQGRESKTKPTAPRRDRSPRELAADRFARMLDCCG